MYLNTLMEKKNISRAELSRRSCIPESTLRDILNGKARLDQCEAVSKVLDAKLDELDPIQEPYILEVCSAGAERALKRPEDFARFLGSPVTVKLYSAREGRKEWPGVLAAWEDGDVVLEDGTRFRKSEVAQVRLRVTFS